VAESASPEHAAAPLLLLDAPSMYFRAFHAVPGSAPDGTPAGAVRGFVDALARLIRDARPAGLVACFDEDWRPAFRVAALPGYKARRVGTDGAEQIPDGLAAQVDGVRSVLDTAGFASAGAPGAEADDVIATLLGRLADRHPGPVEVVTGDRDLFQLVRDDQPVRVRYLGRGGATLVDEAEVTRRYGIPGRRYADFAVLRGDPSDGLPGVPGIGAKTAAELLRRFGSLDEARATAATGRDDGFPAGARRRLAGAGDYLDRAVLVTTVRADVALPTEVDPRLPAAPADPAGLLAAGERWGLAGPLGRLAAALAAAGCPAWAAATPATGSAGG
jgi:5'-3' exonuclease